MVLSGIGAAVMFVLRGRKIGKLVALNQRDEEKVRMLSNGTSANLKEAAKYQANIASRNETAALLVTKTENSLHKAVGHEETLADIANRYNSARVRKRTSKPA